ncbi:hypothetical protein PHISP_05693 [Aspergillus sp. HF37]|nr:hypothetical protein PHISP_05693 [Aspergillus sp. HF37]
MSTPLHPQFFCSRPNGVLTPLVAVDELPASLSIRGAPRALSPSDTQGMTSLGALDPRGQTYVVDAVPVQVQQSHVRDYELQPALARLDSDDALSVNRRLALQAMAQQQQQQGYAQNWSVQNASSANGWVVPAAGGAGSGVGGGGMNGHGHKNVNLSMKKEFCSYWIRHGECDYQQQGCLYKHEMPTDPALLEKLGLRDIPRWYREKYGVPSLLPHGHRSQANNHQAQHWREDAGPKAIQYPSRVGFNGGGEFHAMESDKAQANKHREAANYHYGGGALIPDQPRAYTALNNAPKSPMAHRKAPKTLHVQPKAHMPAAGRFDLLTSDLSDQYDQIAVSGMGDSLGHAMMGHSSAEQAFFDVQAQVQAATDRAQREDIMRNLHALVPASMPSSGGGILDRERPQTPFDATPCPVRSKRSTQQPRRLPYQQHQRSGEDSSWSFKNFRDAVPPPTMSQGRSTGGTHIPTGSKTGSPTIRAGGVGSGNGNGHGHGHGNRGVGVGIGGIGGSTMSSDPPTGPATPEEHSHSSHSSRSGSHALYGAGEKENEQPKAQQHARQHHVQHGHGHGHGQHARDAYHSHSQAQYPYQPYAALAHPHPHPHGAIGSKRMQHQKSGGVDDDLFGLGHMGSRK